MKISVHFEVPEDEAKQLHALSKAEIENLLRNCSLNGGAGVRRTLDFHFSRAEKDPKKRASYVKGLKFWQNSGGRIRKKA
jgi:hypothetical protein